MQPAKPKRVGGKFFLDNSNVTSSLYTVCVYKSSPVSNKFRSVRIFLGKLVNFLGNLNGGGS